MVQKSGPPSPRRSRRFKHEDGGSFRGWMWSIARHKLIDRARGRIGRPTHGERPFIK